tara:strand:- start:698 stop:976 length:279 start_codon:yes stop_codon:yes gene_type:complete
MSDNLTSPCCNTTYELETITNCCSTTFWEGTDICSECKEHAESEGYRCDECDDWFENPEDERYNCGFCGDQLEEDIRYCSRECSVADNTEGV